MKHFADEAHGGFFDTSDDHEELIHRPKNLQDNAIPSGNAMAATVLSKLSLLTGNGELWQAAEQSASMTVKLMSQYPGSFAQWLNAATFMSSEPVEIALVGSQAQLEPLLEVLQRGYRPFQVVAAALEGEAVSLPLLQNRPQVDGQGTAYVCRQFICKAPVTDPGALEEAIQAS
jgi:hypothetical protein